MDPTRPEIMADVINEDRVALRAQVERYKTIIDDACAVRRLPDTDNDGGPGALAEEFRTMMHNHKVEVDELIAQVERLEDTVKYFKAQHTEDTKAFVVADARLAAADALAEGAKELVNDCEISGPTHMDPPEFVPPHASMVTKLAHLEATYRARRGGGGDV